MEDSIEKALQLDPRLADAHDAMGMMQAHQGRFEHAERSFRRAGAERIAALVPRPMSKATIFAALGDKDRTLELLDQLAPTGPVRIGRTLIGPEFAFLGGDPRLKLLREKVGLPE